MVLKSFIRYQVPAILWAAVILVLTLLPATALPPPPHWELLSFSTFCHAAVFALLIFLVVRMFFFYYGKSNLRYAIGVSFVLCLFFGMIIELLQTLMKLGRQGEATDVLSNLIGEIIGIIIFYMLATRRKTG